jgi:hypothetical protein
VDIDMMRPFDTAQRPTCFFQFFDEFRAVHDVYYTQLYKRARSSDSSPKP